MTPPSGLAGPVNADTLIKPGPAADAAAPGAVTRSPVTGRRQPRPAVTTGLPSTLESDRATLSVALSQALERRVARALAKRLLDHFKTLTAVLIADELSLARLQVRAPARRLLADMRRTLRGGLATALGAHQLPADDPVLIEYLLLGQETRPAERVSCLYFDERDRMVAETAWPTPALALPDLGQRPAKRGIVSAVTVHASAHHHGQVGAADLACADACAVRLAAAGLDQRDHFLIVGATYWRAKQDNIG